MKQRSALAFMEQLIMILIFALASALCLQIFVKAHVISQEVCRRDEAAALAQNAAELLKATGGDTDRAESLDDESPYTLVIHRPSTQIPGLAEAEVQVYRNGDLLFTLSTGWQEEMP